MLSNFSSSLFLFLKSKNSGMMSRKLHWKKTRTTPTRRAAGEARPARVQPRPPAGSKWDAHLAEHRESATVQSRTLRRPLRPCEASRRGPKRSRHFFVPCVRKFEILFFWQGTRISRQKQVRGQSKREFSNFFLKKCEMAQRSCAVRLVGLLKNIWIGPISDRSKVTCWLAVIFQIWNFWREKIRKKTAKDKEKGKTDSADAVHAADIGAADFAAVLRIDRDAASAASDAASVTSQPSDGLERRRRRRLPPHRRERLTR